MVNRYRPMRVCPTIMTRSIISGVLLAWREIMRGKGGRQQRNAENLVLGWGLIALLFRRGAILGSFRKEIGPLVNFIELRGRADAHDSIWQPNGPPRLRAKSIGWLSALARADIRQGNIGHLLGNGIITQRMLVGHETLRVAHLLPLPAHINLKSRELGLVPHLLTARHPVAKVDICLLYTSPSPRDRG